MSLVLLFLPLAAACGLAMATAAFHNRLPPMIAARATLAALIATALGALPSLWVITITYLSHQSVIKSAMQWCTSMFGLHQNVPSLVALPATGLSVVGAVRVVRVVRRHLSVRTNEPGPVEFFDSTEPFAVTVPGRGGRIIISTALVDLVSDDELRAVIAHEHTHAEQRHDRFLLTCRIVTAALPMLQPIATRLQFALERWADETAAYDCGDRNLVARALASVALHEPTPAYALGFGALGVTARVEALLTPPVPNPDRRHIRGVWLAIGVTAVLALIQIHHLATMLMSLCG